MLKNFKYVLVLKLSERIFIFLKIMTCLENANIYKYLLKISSLYDFSFLNYNKINFVENRICINITIFSSENTSKSGNYDI